jgi:hypothetical protein
VHSEIITVTIPQATWNDFSGDRSRLICVIDINGTFMHLEAFQVHNVGASNEQQPVNEDHQDDFDLLCRYGTEGEFETTEIDGKPYVLVATPFT